MFELIEFIEQLKTLAYRWLWPILVCGLIALVLGFVIAVACGW